MFLKNPIQAKLYLNLPNGVKVQVFFHCCPHSLVNCYVIGSEPSDLHKTERRDAVVVDPAFIDTAILKFIEDNNLNLRGILIKPSASSKLAAVFSRSSFRRICTATLPAACISMVEKTCFCKSRAPVEALSFSSLNI